MIAALVSIPASAVTVGLVIGLTYALLAAGLLLVFRGTRVLNFAHGQIGALCATALAKLVLDAHWNFFAALAAVVALGALIGAIVELTVVRRLFLAPRLQLFVATIGVAQLLLFVQLVMPSINAVGLYPTPVTWTWSVGGVHLTPGEITALLIAPPVVLGLAWFLKYTRAGLAIRATADNADMAELSGMSARRVSTLVWTLAGGLGALTAVLLFPVLGIALNAPTPALGPGLLLPALAAALVGRMTSLAWALVGGIGVGVLQSLLVVNFPSTPGVVQAVLFGVILILVLLRRAPDASDPGGDRSLAHRVEPLPAEALEVGWLRHLGTFAAATGLAVAVALPWLYPSAGRIFLFSSVLVVAIAGMSVTVLTGWAGQLSLGQYAFVGLGAVTASRLVSSGYSFPTAIAYATIAGAVAAVVVGFPALRIQGLLLAVTTLGFAVAAQGWLFRLDLFRTGDDQLFFRLSRSEVFGIDLSSQRSYYYLCLAVLVGVAVVTTRLRRSGVRRIFVATSRNPRGAESFGLSLAVAKLSAFAYAGALAGLAGALYAGLNVIFTLDGSGEVTAFGPEQSLQIVAMTVIGGLGSIAGAILGAVYVVGLPALFQHNQVVGVASTSIGLLVLLMFAPEGLAGLALRARDRVVRAALRTGPRTVDDLEAMPRSITVREPSQPARTASPPDGQPAETRALQVDELTVEFGGITALDGVSIDVGAGEVVGLIGSNGAGKSTLMNAIGGFQPVSAGTIRLWGQDVSDLPAHERARLGTGRIFQDARLFGDLTVAETVQLATELHESTEFVPALLGFPPARRLERRQAAQAQDLIGLVGLGPFAHRYISDLSTGTRRVVELACLLARGSRVLLLDEPTAGLAQREAEAFDPLIRQVRADLDAAVLLIEHDMPLVMSMSDRMYCFDAGACIAHGLPDQVRSDPAVIAAYLGTDERAIARSGATTASSDRLDLQAVLAAVTTEDLV